jgi:hypothetical protein
LPSHAVRTVRTFSYETDRHQGIDDVLAGQFNPLLVST